MTPLIVAYDLSLTAPGWATWTPDGRIRSGVVTAPKSVGLGAQRLVWLTEMLVHGAPPGVDIDPDSPDRVMVLIEDLPTHAKSAGLTGQVHGAVKAEVWEWWGVEPVLVPAATIKTLATGKGNADKVQMVVAARDRLGYVGTNDNEADALWLLQFGLRLAGAWEIELPKTHTRALDKWRLAA